MGCAISLRRKAGYDKEKNYKELCQMALVSEEVKQYRAIGTPEECRAAVERNNEKNSDN